MLSMPFNLSSMLLAKPLHDAERLSPLPDLRGRRGNCSH